MGLDTGQITENLLEAYWELICENVHVLYGFFYMYSFLQSPEAFFPRAILLQKISIIDLFWRLGSLLR